MIIHSYENGLRADSCIEYIRETKIADAIERLILLPIPSTRDKITILNTKVYISDVLDVIDGKTVISGYGLPEAFVQEAADRGACVLDLSEDEEFLLANADLTAVCALGVILNSVRCAPGDMRIGVVGYGRIGKRLTEIFLYFGSFVRVFSSRSDTRLDLGECGVASSVSSGDADLSGLDILINTAPARIFDPAVIPRELRIIDLASGDNFPGVEGVEKYPSVPARMFPESAGREWGRAIERYLVNNL